MKPKRRPFVPLSKKKSPFVLDDSSLPHTDKNDVFSTPKNDPRLPSIPI
jgi:hypothetical protein